MTPMHKKKVHNSNPRPRNAILDDFSPEDLTHSVPTRKSIPRVFLHGKSQFISCFQLNHLFISPFFSSETRNSRFPKIQNFPQQVYTWSIPIFRKRRKPIVYWLGKILCLLVIPMRPTISQYLRWPPRN